MKETKTLWHYTSIKNALNILANGEIWATHSEFLNDTFELRPLEYFLKYVRKKNYASVLGNRLIETLDFSYQRKVVAFYIISFSALSDAMPLWAAYANFSGCAIGFDKTKLFDFFNSCKGKPFEELNYYPALDGLFRVNYPSSLKNGNYKPLERKIDEIYNQYKDDKKGIISGRNYLALNFCLATKNTTFRFEKEYRFVFMVNFNKIADTVLFNEGRPFIKIKLPKISECVSEIILFPNNISNLTRKAFEFIKEYRSAIENKEVCFKISTSKHETYRNPKV